MEVFPIQCLTVQATPFCNLDCSYCYLPDRKNKALFDLDIIPFIFSNISTSGLLTDSLYWDWHAGEPLVAGIEFYKKSTELIKKLKPKKLKVEIGMQTNGTLITDELAAFFKKNKFRIGVSMDGPGFMHDHNRKYRSGKGSFRDARKGIALLHKHHVPFHIICVLSKKSLEYPDELYEFFNELETSGVAFNIEEIEGIHSISSMESSAAGAQFDAFFQRFFELHIQHGFPFQIREWNKFNALPDGAPINGTTVPFAHLTIGWNGDFSTFSPELITIKNNPRYQDFIFGNIKKDLVIDSLKNQHLLNIYQEIQKGVTQCHNTCAYFDTCGGGMVSNKLFENGTFNSTTTMACYFTEQKLADIVRSFSAQTITV